MVTESNKYLILVAGGIGKRMGADIPKQFLEINGIPLLVHTMKRFLEYDPLIDIILVLPDSELEFWSSYCSKNPFTPTHKTITGGKERFYSVKNGLASIKTPGIIAIHDGVRPLVSRNTISRCFDKAEKSGNAIPVISPSESIRQISKDSNSAIDRDSVKLVQTPQVFDAEILREAYNCTYSRSFTDDATVVEKLGVKINLVEGNRENIKITTPADLEIARALIK
ncbi:MAG: 2-C-methyl-D-erythritol 4-phosphate cytidylyltransferase [Bacteroidales bacterium]|nr:2-C-methyl-D-erythritol 4-phosphate cytidylyltransferase [Bacteroidales bacterium]